MRTHGWHAQPPTDPDDARRRLIDAAMTCVDQYGARTTVADVARTAGVTRQTVYRYFPGIESLLVAVARDAATDYVRRLWEHAGKFTQIDDFFTECLAFCVETLPGERYVSLLLEIDEERFWSEAVSDEALALARDALRHMPGGWESLQIDDAEQEEGFHFILTLLRPLITRQASEPLDPEWLRRYLRRWVLPALLEPVRIAAEHS